MSRSLAFSKYHGLGNDFVLVPLQDLESWRGHVTEVCDRHRGIGADGIIGYEQREPGVVTMVIYNQDGSRPQMCGNGVRCVVAALVDQGKLEPGSSVVIESDAGPRASVATRGKGREWLVEVDMGSAVLGDLVEGRLATRALSWRPVDMGNPHAVTWFEAASLDEVDEMGEAANLDKGLFPQGVNVEFVTKTDKKNQVDVVVYERGVGRTQACGTGACAVAAALWEEGFLSKKEVLNVALPGGVLSLRHGQEGHVWMTGPAVHVFDGQWVMDRG